MSRLVGITGSREEPTLLQAARLGACLAEFQHTWSATDLVHGDATGFDALAHDIGTELGYIVTVRPPDNPAHRAFRTGHHMHRPAPYMTRNRTIAAHCDLLLGGPAAAEDAPESHRSGTWATIRMARRLGKPIVLIWPDGKVTTDTPRTGDDKASNGHGGRHQPAGHQDLDQGAVAPAGRRGRQ